MNEKRMKNKKLKTLVPAMVTVAFVCVIMALAFLISQTIRPSSDIDGAGIKRTFLQCTF